MIERVVFFGISALCAGLFGSLHNQVSYTLGPDYFHSFKFIQFQIHAPYHNRIGAAWVGWLASWWMGPLLGGVIILAIGRLKPFRVLASIAILITFTVAAFAALIGAILGQLALQNGAGSLLEAPRGLIAHDYIAAGTMHDASYLGAVAGALLAIVCVKMKGRRDGV